MTETHLEEKIAHLERGMDELSDLVARQDRLLEVLSRRVEMLMEREAAREAAETGALPLQDGRPPHY